jgi:hypothetical protein
MAKLFALLLRRTTCAGEAALTAGRIGAEHAGRYRNA